MSAIIKKKEREREQFWYNDVVKCKIKAGEAGIYIYIYKRIYIERKKRQKSECLGGSEPALGRHLY